MNLALYEKLTVIDDYWEQAVIDEEEQHQDSDARYNFGAAAFEVWEELMEYVEETRDVVKITLEIPVRPFPIHNDEDLDRAIVLVQQLWECEEGSEEERTLDIMATLIDTYERDRFGADFEIG